MSFMHYVKEKIFLIAETCQVISTIRKKYTPEALAKIQMIHIESSIPLGKAALLQLQEQAFLYKLGNSRVVYNSSFVSNYHEYKDILQYPDAMFVDNPIYMDMLQNRTRITRRATLRDRKAWYCLISENTSINKMITFFFLTSELPSMNKKHHPIFGAEVRDKYRIDEIIGGTAIGVTLLEYCEERKPPEEPDEGTDPKTVELLKRGSFPANYQIKKLNVAKDQFYFDAFVARTIDTVFKLQGDQKKTMREMAATSLNWVLNLQEQGLNKNYHYFLFTALANYPTGDERKNLFEGMFYVEELTGNSPIRFVATLPNPCYEEREFLRQLNNDYHYHATKVEQNNTRLKDYLLCGH